MNSFFQSIRNNRILLLWFLVFVLFLVFTKTGSGEIDNSLITAVWTYWTGGELQVLIAALAATLATALPVTIAILFISLSMACLSYFKPKTSKFVSLFMGLSLLPTVYLIFLIKTLITGIPVDNKGFLVAVLTFSNLVLFFFYIEFRKDLFEEFEKEYHTFSRILGIGSVLVSARKRIVFILMERFKTLFVLVFSSTIFAEHKLDVSGGIYSLFYKTVTSAEGRMDIFYGQLLFILLFVVLFLVLYDTFINYIKNRNY